MQKRAFEKTGLIPRSIIRTFDRFKKQLLYGSESFSVSKMFIDINFCSSFSKFFCKKFFAYAIY